MSKETRLAELDREIYALEAELRREAKANPGRMTKFWRNKKRDMEKLARERTELAEGKGYDFKNPEHEASTIKREVSRRLADAMRRIPWPR